MTPLFWLLAVAVTLVVAVFVIAPMLRGRPTSAGSENVNLYKAQLSEIDSDAERGLIAPEEAERAKTEVARRLLAANKATFEAGTAPAHLSKGMALAAVVVALGVSAVAYLRIGAPGEPDQPLAERLAMAAEMRENRPSQAEFEAVAPPPPEIEAPEDYLESVEQLRAIVPTRMEDLRGWQLLAYHETELRNYAAAARAQSQVLRLSDGGSTADKVLLVDLLVAAADGQVSPEAEAVVRRVLQEDEENVAARYYLGSLHNLTGRPDIAFRIWRPLVEQETDSFHVALARAQIENAAARAGVDYTPPEVRGPSAADIAAAEDMTEEDRTAMIQNMVGGLAERLATEGGPASDWARLISAYGVLGETERASAIWNEARTAFASDPDAIALLRNAAESAGVAE